ncbi:MAG TPA: NUDIX hydrolase [Gammaproteobacteria bacterium]
MTQRIDVTVAALIERSGRFLLVEEQAGGDIVFNQPAGHLEPEESLIEAVIRETREETGFAFRPHSLLGIYQWHCVEADTTFLRFAFCGDAKSPSTTPVLDEGIIATHWLTAAQIAAREPRLRSPLVRRCIDDYLAGTRHPLSVVAEIPTEQLVALTGA